MTDYNPTKTARTYTDKQIAQGLRRAVNDFDAQYRNLRRVTEDLRTWAARAISALEDNRE